MYACLTSESYQGHQDGLLPIVCALPAGIVDHSAYASAATFAEDQSATTSLASKHLGPAANYQAEATAK